MKFWCVRGKGIVEENPYGFLMGMLLNKGIYIEVHKITLANQKLHTAIIGLICFLSLHFRAEYYIYCRYYIRAQPETEGTSVKVERKGQPNFLRSRPSIPMRSYFFKKE